MNAGYPAAQTDAPPVTQHGQRHDQGEDTEGVGVYQFFLDERGSAAIEYALIAVVVSAGIIAGISGIPDALNAMLGDVAEGFE